MKRYGWLLALLAVFLLPACGGDQLPPEPEEGVLIYAALNPVSNELKESVQKFNENHPDARIEIRDYSDEGGIERLRTELVLGRVPDIMEMHYYGKSGPQVAEDSTFFYVLPGSYTEAADEYWMPYRIMAQKGYLEDLWPYIENDPDLGRDGVMQAPLKAAEVNNGLYILFQKVVIFTLTGRESVVGNRYSWTMEELLEVLEGMPEGSTILRYNMTRQEAFFNFLRFSLDRFVDQEAGTCDFDSQGFRDLLRFLESLPDKSESEDPADAEEEVKRRIRNGQQMLEGKMISWQIGIGISDAIWQERAAFPGYPTADGSSGSFFYPPGTILAMSSACRDKEAAWEYIRELIRPRCNKAHPLAPLMNIPVNANDYEMLLWGELVQLRKLIDRAGTGKFFKKFMETSPSTTQRHFRHGPDLHLMHVQTEEDSQRHRDLVNHTTQLYWPNDELSDLVWDSIGPYLAGDRSLDDTVALVQNRAQLYVNELR